MKTRPKQLLGSLLLDIVLPGPCCHQVAETGNCLILLSFSTVEITFMPVVESHVEIIPLELNTTFLNEIDLEKIVLCDNNLVLFLIKELAYLLGAI